MPLNKAKAAERHRQLKKLPKRQYKYLKREADKLGLGMLSISEFIELRAQHCHYCNNKLPETGYCIDRKDSQKGYTIDNVVPCCSICNFTKTSVWSYEEYLQLAPIVSKLLSERLVTGHVSRFPHSKK